ncbi:MAG: ATP-dependent DNA ligase [Desulfofustis sp.]|nr:ATP-dependent DNA ligase [Desulfofustis sp.]
MRRFTRLFIRLEETNKTTDKLAALIEYFKAAPARDAAWAVTYLTGKRPRSPVNGGQIRSWVQEAANIPEWLFTESYSGVGDLAETVSLLLPDPGKGSALGLSDWIEKRLLALAEEPDEALKHQTLLSWWSELDRPGRFVLTKLLTGAWRVGVSQRLVTRALAQSLTIEADVIAHRLMGAWQPDDSFYTMLSSADTSDADISKPYPFCLAYPLDQDPQSLGDRQEWLAEWKWDGIRGQVIKRQGQVSIWSRGEELVTARFPEIEQAAEQIADGTVVDGEILAWSTDEDSVMAFGHLQKRIGRKTVGKKLLREVPVTFMAYDLLEERGEDIRKLPFDKRRALLEEIIGGDFSAPALRLSPLVAADSWQALDERRQQSREIHVEGFVLKHRRSPYGVGRKRGDWWKWKIEPYSVDGVLLYAQRGSGRRASLYTDYTFGIWQGDKLVPFAKAYSGLNDIEIREVDRFVRRNTVEKFGPVRSVPPELVMELHFEGIRRSTRHKSGLAVRFPRIARWRKDKSADQADALETIMALLPASERDK